MIEALRRLALQETQLARASARRIRLRLLKVGGVITVSVRRIKVALSSAYVRRVEFLAAFKSLRAAARYAAPANQSTVAAKIIR